MSSPTALETIRRLKATLSTLESKVIPPRKKKTVTPTPQPKTQSLKAKKAPKAGTKAKSVTSRKKRAKQEFVVLQQVDDKFENVSAIEVYDSDGTAYTPYIDPKTHEILRLQNASPMQAARRVLRRMPEALWRDRQFALRSELRKTGHKRYQIYGKGERVPAPNVIAVDRPKQVQSFKAVVSKWQGKKDPETGSREKPEPRQILKAQVEKIESFTRKTGGRKANDPHPSTQHRKAVKPKRLADYQVPSRIAAPELFQDKGEIADEKKYEKDSKKTTKMQEDEDEEEGIKSESESLSDQDSE